MESFVLYIERLQKELKEKIKERRELLKKIYKGKDVKKLSSKNYNIIQSEVFHLQDILGIMINELAIYKESNPKV